MEAAGRRERALRVEQASGQRGDNVAGHLERALDPLRCDLDGLDRALPADAARRRRVEVPLEALGIEPIGVDVDRVRCEIVRNPSRARREALRQAEAERELLVVAGRAHGDGDWLSADADLERLLDGDEIVLLRALREPQGGDASCRVRRRLGHAMSVLGERRGAPRVGASARGRADRVDRDRPGGRRRGHLTHGRPIHVVVVGERLLYGERGKRRVEPNAAAEQALPRRARRRLRLRADAVRRGRGVDASPDRSGRPAPPALPAPSDQPDRPGPRGQLAGSEVAALQAPVLHLRGDHGRVLQLRRADAVLRQGLNASRSSCLRGRW